MHLFLIPISSNAFLIEEQNKFVVEGITSWILDGKHPSIKMRKSSVPYHFFPPSLDNILDIIGIGKGSAGADQGESDSAINPSFFRALICFSIHIEVTVTYEDADLSQLEKVTLHKKTKYASLSNVIVMAFGHAGIYLPSVIEEIKDLLPFSDRQAFRIADDGARIAMKESCRILRKRFSQSQHL
ncbi:hypothetical protein ADUPG1_010600 [Aduncisulcus paluster]|uniref:Uncharacterized protein n=2 Tax=Aduncisulcus paluster TaxID=2918883 RepID=A0ABQ5JWJ8_9EUKA|nr:hypothetical protein ADUPG1_010600 [Aduncisulcus paluster]